VLLRENVPGDSVFSVKIARFYFPGRVFWNFWSNKTVEMERRSAGKMTEEGPNLGTQVGKRDLDRSVDLARARELGRGREANTPEQIPPRGWRDILWRVFWSISADRIFSTSGGVAFFALLAVFPGIAAIVSVYGLFADASTISKHLSLLSGFLPNGVLG
jgi:hypothetical protein